MLNRIVAGNASIADQGPNMFLARALTLSIWNPFLAGVLGGNTRVHDGFGAIVSEWQTFLRHRLTEDYLLMQRLTRNPRPDLILAAYTEFWWKAVDDYGKEITTMTKLMTGVTTKMVVTQSATDDASSMRAFPSRKAA